MSRRTGSSRSPACCRRRDAPRSTEPAPGRVCLSEPEDAGDEDDDVGVAGDGELVGAGGEGEVPLEASDQPLDLLALAGGGAVAARGGALVGREAWSQTRTAPGDDRPSAPLACSSQRCAYTPMMRSQRQSDSSARPEGTWM